ncbi:hypothetical protein LUZ63_001319 [Rhynchospora breviuscula]|uniref:Carbonic anhydrase n=1 Tax=Rhynchospora breviuscula TaxID=2022672 RepID=A0A9Q0CX62_9POAL|nr:hypothetical protein LUZ63_001319 [Rhynchospora breviuscula]
MKTMVIPTFFTICILLSIPLASAQEVEDERPFNYKVGDKKGPGNWGKMNKTWAICNSGQHQSPIDLSVKKAHVDATMGGLNNLYRPEPRGLLKNRGHDIEVKFLEDAGGVQMFSDIFFLTQMHWHMPSEHTINGKRYPLELHLIHQTPDGSKLSASGQLYDIGKPDEFLTELEHHLLVLAKKNLKEKKVNVVKMEKLQFDTANYFRYNGSLTTPPCTEGVIWNVFKNVKTVSKHQLNLLKNAAHDGGHENSRPLQPLNGRVVDVTKEKKAN